MPFYFPAYLLFSVSVLFQNKVFTRFALPGWNILKHITDITIKRFADAIQMF